MPTSVPPEVNNKQRHTLFVLNNWTAEELETCREYARKEAAYMCWSQEVGEKNLTPHLQGYVHWTSPRSLRKFQDRISPRLHWGDKEGYTSGTAQQNKAYCQGLVKKKGFILNPTFEEYGEIPQQGERTDWVKALDDLKTLDVINTIDAQPHLLPCIRALQTYKQIGVKGTHRSVDVIVLTGPPGCGKTKWAWDTYPDLYSKPEGQWWDGYAGQDTILLDDYYGFLPYSQLLKVCDRYPLVLPVKGGFVSAQFTRVIITSNHVPGSWYPGDVSALERRISEYRNMNITDAVQEITIPQAPLCPTPKARRTVKAILPPEDKRA